jgi:hypothetical protein
MQPLKKLEDTVASWPRISVFPHRFGGREFRFANAEVGHVHDGGIVDIPFPRSVRDALLTEGLAGHFRCGADFLSHQRRVLCRCAKRPAIVRPLPF